MADKFSAINSLIGGFRAHLCAWKSEGYIHLRSVHEALASENLGACILQGSPGLKCLKTHEFLVFTPLVVGAAKSTALK
jgi:hypothetical protein